ncbi:MAG: HNH endonuclease [Nitrososphaerota archaeon]|nr:HNH endonuclease [Nitrososphaerota archaeon]
MTHRLPNQTPSAARKSFRDYYGNTFQTLNNARRERIVRDLAKFRATVEYLLNEKIPLARRLNDTAVRGAPLQVEGLGKGIASDFLMICHPRDYILWNEVTFQGLSRLGLFPKFPRGLSLGDRYLRVLEAARYVRSIVGVRDFLAIDLFFYFVGAKDRGLSSAQPALRGFGPARRTPLPSLALVPAVLEGWSREEVVVILELAMDPTCGAATWDPQVREVAGLLTRGLPAVVSLLKDLRAAHPISVVRPEMSDLFKEGEWRRLCADPDALHGEVTSILRRLSGVSPLIGNHILEQKRRLRLALLRKRGAETEAIGSRKFRLLQDEFREVVLDGYSNQCAMCDVKLPALLIASHIVPWSATKTHRLNPENGIALCALHDKAFDRHLISVHPNGKLWTSRILRTANPRLAAELDRTGRLRFPRRGPRPDATLLAQHLEAAISG